MPDTPTASQESIDELRRSAERCRRLAASITDRQTHDRLLEMARECEESAKALDGRGSGSECELDHGPKRFLGTVHLAEIA
jgi:hypothetical protein